MYCKSRARAFGAEVKRRILIGTYVLSHGYYDAYYLQAQRIRR
jgi:aspartyl-tRNA(Asn)/glutamyl-tRNA(Gln) amidotransferase subunit A